MEILTLDFVLSPNKNNESSYSGVTEDKTLLLKIHCRCRFVFNICTYFVV